ncbi:U11/U12 small nuclear ribonucleoprotein 48 kDa protein [Phtheirospermum japonicum]|uniref:U11/U12 small nuclear ribonucleoprotein 48 kDa protein n=1 Tax=Phtheirospermum japonicum TaxID=374723 RepID=A0A830CFB2_9LAMI|nr:U11/U12 small nuclear ribonucleoprotein 48 kDa protein [Phtheirospermum japonicum]
MNPPPPPPPPPSGVASSTTAAATSVSLSTTSSDLSVSLENYAFYNANYFYEKCPGPVTPSIRPPPFFHFPRVLHIECADFNEDSPAKEPTDFPADFIRFLPSEIWAIRSETETWGGVLPPAYSSRILRAILRLRDCNLSHLNDWIVSSSPRYGVVIDFAMRDHLVSLVRLCLKAIIREAFALGGFMFGNGKSTNQSFECPVLVKVMTWLALQFSVLYGEVNGKFFAVDVLRECLSDSASHASLFPLEQNDDGEGENVRGETVGNSMIFISQVAAAVAALHERLFIEEKIKALRNSRPVSAYERNMEHAYVSKIADEERLKRPDYKPIIEHDGFLWQRPNNQEGNKVKTREELLAEERDYKRRRVSYRGKKSNRNTTEVMRGIIEKFMEEIKQAGGIGDVSKSLEKTEPLGSENLNAHSSAADVSRPRRNSETPEENRDRSLDYDIQRLRRDSSRDRGYQDPNKRSVERIRHDRDGYYSGRPHQRETESREKKHHKSNRDDEREQNNHERERDEHERDSRKRGRYEDSKEHGDRRGSKTGSARRERDVDIRDRKTNRNSRSSHRELHEFDDRYDPAESRGFYEDDF